ncbi:E3 ubiquitin-protein ligase ATL4-like [Rutidosis leptorrhynchoides]|uniref:E3 ubiquitin-protein ligase ATL4-like n=1 Tax=Rutidosis leptorrhynchoides TaxID=125765 RepID=UPI003A9991DE
MAVATTPGGGESNNETADSVGDSASSSSWWSSTLSPSITIIILILTSTLVISVGICLLLRLLNRRCIRHLSTVNSAASSVAALDSLRHSGRRVSPENSKIDFAAFNSLIESLPIFTFASVTSRRAPSTFNTGDCAVCLSKFEAEDQLRLLPMCCHAFHVGCIDTWLMTNQTCPLCRSVLIPSDSEQTKAALPSSDERRNNSFRLQIGSLSRRRQTASIDFDVSRVSSYSLGSFDYIVEEEAEIVLNQTHRRNASDKAETEAATAEGNLAAEVGGGRNNWLQDYVDRLSVSSRAFSGRFFSGSSRRTTADIVVFPGEINDLEANRVGEEITEMFRWFSGV